MKEKRTLLTFLIMTAVCLGLLITPAFSQVMTKAQVGELIKRVEDGVDEFKDYLERRSEDARDRVSSPEAQSRRGRRGRNSSADTDARKEVARDNKDELEDGVKDLEKATDRLRRRFKRSNQYMETKVQVERVVDEAKEVNQFVVSLWTKQMGSYGSEVARIWAALPPRINELARVYGVKPLAI